MAKSNNRRIITIDILRSTAAILIVLFHYTTRYFQLTKFNTDDINCNWPISVSFGYGAIATFFILSGYLVSHYFTIGGGNVKKYLTKRFFRLYPTYWLCIVISCLALYDTSYTVVSVKTILYNMTMIPSCFKVNYIDGAYWTMQMEFFFSIIIIFTMFLTKNLKFLFLIIWTLITLVFNSFNLSEYELGTFCNMIFKLINLFLMPNYAAYFIGGISVYQLANENISNVKRIIYYVLTVSSVASIYLVNKEGPILYFTSITLLLLLLIKYIEKPLESKINHHNIFSFIAIISYPLYLLHQYFGYVVMNKLIECGFNNEVIIIIPIIIMLTLAALLHKYFEIPLTKIEKKILNREQISQKI